MIRISFDAPNLGEAEFILTAVRRAVDAYRTASAAPDAPPAAPVVEAPPAPYDAPVTTPGDQIPPKRPRGRPRKETATQPETVGSTATNPEPVVSAPAPTPTPVAVAAPANIFDAPTPAAAPVAAPAQSGKLPKDIMGALYSRISDAKGSGEAIKVTMGLLREFGVARVQDLPQEKWVAFEQRAGGI